MHSLGNFEGAPEKELRVDGGINLGLSAYSARCNQSLKQNTVSL